MPQTPETVHAVCLKWMGMGRVPKHLVVNDKGQMRKEHAAAILQYVADHYDGHVTVENLDKAVTKLMRMEKIPSPPKPQVSEKEKQRRRQAEEHRRKVAEMGLVTPNRVNHAHKQEENKSTPVTEVVQDLRDRMRSNIESLQIQIQKPEPKLKRLPLDATATQLKAASPEQLRDYISRKKHTDSTAA